MKKIKYLFIAVFSLMIVASCSNFEELNTNPDVPNSVAPEMLATQVLKDSYRFWNPNSSDYSFANLFNKHTVIFETNPNPYQYYFSYSPYGSFPYGSLTELKRMVEFSKGGAYESSFKGLALFLKASALFDATIELGDIPYSEAGMAEEGITKPKYDKQADVIVSILNDLKEAEAYFAAGVNFNGDIMYGGNVTKWRKLCNAYQLKVLQTISKKITPEQKARFAAIVSAGNLMTSSADNYQLAYSTNTNASYPYFNGEATRLKHGLSKLVVDALKTNNDRRLFYFAEPAPALITGGATASQFVAYEGAPTQLAALPMTLNYQAGKYSLLNKRYPLYRDNDPFIKFPYAEQCFIIAEAIEEGWVAGNSQTYYENGVKASLEYYKNLPNTSSHVHGMAITQAYIDGYFVGAAAYAGTKVDRLRQIWTQRWLIDFMQARSYYPQFLRVGYPVYPLDPLTSMNPDDPTLYPQRWKYPTSELTTNGVNYLKAVDEQYGGYDGINLKPWYLK
ncbi:SusD/RagB family nutrient-binding outer membrane lipoprotein [Lutibacter sp.]|uniref:SusD/RagB family nutrient-binding outer membrane lipoprotein n=1 Tax=Lutibacter sp. TaxID=1925666 RepID=UPI002732A91D|nr:SusD/RagB family nutrient-binding outer membrane lipoprotein [Lutibacter sp.]MDP3313695.1 SusD/RagB family nutrient-binding outer membrane lipoprotein [Lutibacter sp.]